LAGAVGFDSDEPKRLAKLLGIHPAPKGDGTELMSVESRCQVTEYRICRVSGHTLNNQLSARNTQRESGSVDQQGLEARDYSVDGGGE